jgi:multiple sugar transport system substrate-binding protein
MIVMSLLGLLMGCQKSSEDVLEQADLMELLMPKQVQQQRKAEGVFRIWTYDKEAVPDLTSFYANYKDLEVEVDIVVKEDYIFNYIEALAKDEAPDMMIINHKDFGSFNDLNPFMDLSEKEDIVKAMTVDDQKSRFYYGKAQRSDALLGVLVGLKPWCFYYRADILEDMGYDKDPIVIGQLLQDPEAYLELMLQLKGEDRYIWMWPDEMMLIHLAQRRFHKDNYRIDLSQGQYKDVYEISKMIQKERLFSGESIYDTGGAKAVEEERIVGVFLPTWGPYFLRDFFPNTSGKWKMTQMPLGLNQMDGNMVLIHKDTAYEEMALKLLLDLVEADTNEMRFHEHEINVFMSGQKVGKVYQDAINQFEAIYHTAEDPWIQTIYEQAMREGISLGWSYEEVLQQVSRRIGEGQTEDEH